MKRIGLYKASLTYGLLLCLSMEPAFAAFERPVTWSDMSALDLRPVFQSPYASPANLYDPAIPVSAFELVLRDADKRVNPEFHIPPSMRDMVGFWLRIYTEYSTQHVVIFDSTHPDIVYEVLDFRQLATTARNRVVYEIQSKHKIKSTMRAYRAALARLARHPNPKNPTPIEAKLIEIRKGKGNSHSFAEMAQHLRAQTGQRDNIIKGLLAAEAFFPKMEDIFKNMGVPAELTRLSLVESSFNLNAISRVGASGVWQFMRPSAKEYLLVDERIGIDERVSPLKSTVAAAKLLKRNYEMLDQWALAVTSYNHGLRGLIRVANNKKKYRDISKLFDLCIRDRTLGWASRNYYAEFLAVLHAEAYRNYFYGTAPDTYQFNNLAFIQLEKPTAALPLMLEHGISLQEFRFLNPEVKDLKRKLPPGFWLVLPGGHEDKLEKLAKARRWPILVSTRSFSRVR